MIASTRQQGYALRDPLSNPRSSTMAVPVFEGGRVVATLGFTWIAAAMTVAQAVERHLPDLQQMARTVSAELDGERAGFLPPHMAGADRGFGGPELRSL